MQNILSEDNNKLYYDFINYYKHRVSPKGFITIKSISLAVITWFQAKNIPINEITIKNAIEYKKYLHELEGDKKLCPGSICNYLKMSRKLFRYMIKFELTQTNPFNEVKYPRCKDNLGRNILNEIQMNKLMDTLKLFDNPQNAKERLERYRLHTISVLLYSTGIRISEIASLLPEDIDIKRREIVIRNGKGGKSRKAFLSGYAADVLDYYLHYGRKIMLSRGWRKHSEKLFGADTATLANAVNKRLEYICASIGIPVITCHGFRHSIGTHLLKAGCDIRHIQLILGHEKLNSTQIYTRVNSSDLLNIIDNYHPRQPLLTRQLTA